MTAALPKLSVLPLHPKRPARPRPDPPTRLRYGPLGPALVSLGYHAAQTMRERSGGLPSGGSGDAHLTPDRDALRRTSQEFERDNGLYIAIVERAIDNILGQGFGFQARTPDAEINQKIEQELWPAFCEAPEVRGIFDWDELVSHVATRWFVDGDIGAILLRDAPQIQLQESEQIVSPGTGSGARDKAAAAGGRIVDGVELDRLGKPVGYWVAQYGDSGQVKGQRRRIEAENFLFLANRLRPSQTRGVPPMQSNFATFWRMNDIFDSEAAAWQILSRFAVAIQRKDAAELALATSDEAQSGEQPPTLAQRVHDVGNAVIFHGEPGEEIRGVERNIPGANFTESVRMFVRLVGLPMGLPLELILLDWSEANYSSSRAQLEQAYIRFRRRQSQLRRFWHQPLYRWLVKRWVADGELPAIDGIERHEWIMPPFPWIDLLKEAEALGMGVDRGISTYGDALKMRNKDRVTVISDRAVEIDQAIATARALETKYPGVQVDWQHFAGLLPPKALPAPGGEDETAPAKGGGDDKPRQPQRPRP